MFEDLIIRFSKEHPCWTKELLERAGAESAGLEELEREGLLLRRGDIYCLSEAGRQVFFRISEELFLYKEPGDIPDDPARALMTTELWMELERCNLQCSGLKRYLFRPHIPVRPVLSRGDVWTLKEGTVLWNYCRQPAVREMVEEHPLPRLHDRRPEPPDPRVIQKWESLPSELFIPDLACIINYDFTQYLDFKGHPGDSMKLINTDRFFFSADGDMESQLDALGQFQRWLLELRHLRISGYVDLDTQEQNSVNWLIFLTEHQKTALEAQAVLKQFGPSLIEPANPMEVWTLSLEAFRCCPSRCEVIWDVLPEAGLPVCLTG